MALRQAPIILEEHDIAVLAETFIAELAANDRGANPMNYPSAQCLLREDGRNAWVFRLPDVVLP